MPRFGADCLALTLCGRHFVQHQRQRSGQPVFRVSERERQRPVVGPERVALQELHDQPACCDGSVDAGNAPCLPMRILHVRLLHANQSPTNVSWPPQGLHLEVHFTAPSGAPSQHQSIDLAIHYEMYTGFAMLVVCDWRDDWPQDPACGEVDDGGADRQPGGGLHCELGDCGVSCGEPPVRAVFVAVFGACHVG